MHGPQAPEAAPINPYPQRVTTAFDFDGTLTVRDTFVAFLIWRSRGWARLSALFRLAPDLIAYALHRDRGRLKAAAVRAFLGGVDGAALSAEAESFADEVFANMLRPDALAEWTRRRAAGEQLVIVTASPEPVIAPFARRLQADRLLGTRLALDARGRIRGSLDGPNCRGEEKVRRLYEAFGPVRLAAAYGDTSGDIAMLAIADAAFMKVFKARPASRRRQPKPSV